MLLREWGSIRCNAPAESGVGGKARTRHAALRRTQHFAEAVPQSGVCHRDNHVFVARFEDLIGHDSRCDCQPRRRWPGGERYRSPSPAPTQLAVEQRLIDELALSRPFACVQPARMPSADHPRSSCLQWRPASASGSPCGIARGGHQARLGLRHEIVAAAARIRPRAPIARDRSRRSVRVVAAHSFWIESHLVQRFYFAHIAYKHVAFSSRRRMVCLAVLARDVNGDAALVAFTARK